MFVGKSLYVRERIHLRTYVVVTEIRTLLYHAVLVRRHFLDRDRCDNHINDTYVFSLDIYWNR